MTNNTIVILNKVQEYDSRMKVKFTEGEFQITATLMTTAPLAVMLNGNLTEWNESEKTLWDEPEEYFKRQLRDATEECDYFADLLNLLKGVKLDDFDSDTAIFEIEDSVKLIIER